MYKRQQQASPEVIGRVLMQAAREIIGAEGAFAILTTTSSASNQAQWVSWMLREIEEKPDLYGEMTLVDTLYGADLYEPCLLYTSHLLNGQFAVNERAQHGAAAGSAEIEPQETQCLLHEWCLLFFGSFPSLKGSPPPDAVDMLDR